MEFAELISNLGFPMVCAIAMGVYVKGMTDKSNTQFLSMFEEYRADARERCREFQ